MHLTLRHGLALRAGKGPLAEADFPNVDFSRGKDTPECWAELRILLAVRRAKSLSGAAQSLGLSVKTVTRACARIQDMAKETLYVVSPNGVRFTEAGERVLASCAIMEREVNALFYSLALPRSRQIRGSIRISVTEGMSGAFIGPNIFEFIKAHPEVSVEIVNPASFNQEDVVDISVCFDSNDKLYVYSPAGHLHLTTIASKRYVDLPTTPPINVADGHSYIQCTYYRSLLFSRWNHIKAKGKTSVTCESSLSLVTTVISGAGIGLLANYTLVDHRLVALPLGVDVYIPIYIGVLKSRKNNPAVRAGSHWLADIIGGSKWFNPGDRKLLPQGDESLDLGANVLNLAHEE